MLKGEGGVVSNYFWFCISKYMKSTRYVVPRRIALLIGVSPGATEIEAE